MDSPGILERIRAPRSGVDETLRDLVRAAAGGAPMVRVFGCHGAFLGRVAAQLAGAQKVGEQPLVVIVAEEARAQEVAQDVGFFLTSAAADKADPLAPPRVVQLPAVEISPYADLSPDRRAILRRQAVLFRLAHGMAGDVLVLSATALARRVIPREGLMSLCDLLQTGEELSRERTLARLAAAGYQSVSLVEDPGTFAARGGVLDLFSPLYRFPVRLELDGDLVESIRFFDPSTQRTLRTLDEVYVHPVRETVLTAGADPRKKILAAADAAAHPSGKTRAVLDHIEAGEDFFGIEQLAPAFHSRMATLGEYLPQGALLLVEDPEAVRAEAHREFVRATEAFHARLAEHRLALPPEEFALDDAGVDQELARHRRVEARRVELHGEEAPEVPDLRFEVGTNAELAAELTRARAAKGDHLLRPLAERVRENLSAGRASVFVVPNLTHAERLEALLRGCGFEPARAESHLAFPPGVHVALGRISHGFDAGQTVFYTEDELFGPRAQRRPQKPPGAAAFGDFRELKAGDFVVHVEHGIGQYRGLVKLAPTSRSAPLDFLHLEYDGGTLYVPVYRLAQVQRYLGADQQAPQLDKIGGKTWEAKRRKVSTEVKKLAEDLLQIYAQRQALPGHGFPAPDAMFREFEATFPFEETPDQQKAIEDVIGDMEQARPMDRLVCGDVGYGKTEVALRAALKAVLGGKQVAVLAPTTVLVEQHFVTFGSRFADYPVRVGVLSRFKPREEQQKTVALLAEGKLDVVVGTHRLLSKDVHFKDLGLIVIDEEQRFGVTHKERLRALKTQVDTLTLTATPIPRTLHLALVGLREISIIATPPADRLAIRTFVARWDDQLLRDAMRRELARGGQIFFVHNRVDDIERWAGRVRELAPEARIAIGHGQMDERALEHVMVDFVDGKFDILVCTTIIESGLDIPRANTMIVNHADRFGLAQLYQLRGRIGRARERAFCYLIVPPLEKLTGEAKQRLEVLQRFTELGAGFQIAQHDLEIRGAGELLGARQSGQIAAVGFEMYSKILEDAVAELKGEAIHSEIDPDLTTDLPGYIPDDYCPDTGSRLDFYKRLSGAADEDEVRAVLEEMADRFGGAPDEVGILGELMVCKGYARRMGALALDLSAERLQLTLPQETPLSPEKVLALVNRKGSRYRLTPDMRLVRTLGEDERKDRLRAYRAVLQEVLSCAT
jgi:transcription-repair coupling factor (superfamily II helicase)